MCRLGFQVQGVHPWSRAVASVTGGHAGRTAAWHSVNSFMVRLVICHGTFTTSVKQPVWLMLRLWGSIWPSCKRGSTNAFFNGIWTHPPKKLFTKKLKVSTSMALLIYDIHIFQLHQKSVEIFFTYDKKSLDGEWIGRFSHGIWDSGGDLGG